MANGSKDTRFGMRKIRIIPRLDIKAPNLIKGIRLEGLRKVGDPQVFAHKYYQDGADELLYMDIVASLYERNSILDIVEKTALDVFIPMTVGGGIRSIDDAKEALRSGADKIALNTAAIRDPELITKIAGDFGSQCVVVSIEAIAESNSKWKAYTDNGREHTGLDAVEWAKKAVELGAGEILITSVDKEGGGKGFDIPLVKAICDEVEVPVIASGGMGELEHIAELVQTTSVDAVAIAKVLHYEDLTISEIKAKLYG